MKTLKNILLAIMVLAIVTHVPICFGMTNKSTLSNIATRKITRVGALYNNRDFHLLINKDLEDIQKENSDKVKFTFFNGHNDPSTQIQIINNMIKDNFDLILANPSDKREDYLIEIFINQAKNNNIPLILYNVMQNRLDAIKGYSKSLIISTDTKESGILQGKMIADTWNTNKKMLIT